MNYIKYILYFSFFSLVSSDEVLKNDDTDLSVKTIEKKEEKNDSFVFSKWIDNPIIGAGLVGFSSYGIYRLLNYHKEVVEKGSKEISKVLENPIFTASSNLEKVLKIGALIAVTKSSIVTLSYLFHFIKSPVSMLNLVYKKVKKALKSPLEGEEEEKAKKKGEKELLEQQLEYYKRVNSSYQATTA